MSSPTRNSGRRIRCLSSNSLIAATANRSSTSGQSTCRRRRPRSIPCPWRWCRSCNCHFSQATAATAKGSAVVLVIGSAVADGRMDAVEHRNPSRQCFEIAFAVGVGDVALAARNDNHRRMQAGEDLLVGLDQPAVPDADGSDARIRGNVVRHQATAGHAHRGHARGVHFLIEAAAGIRRLASKPVDRSGQRRTVGIDGCRRSASCSAGRSGPATLSTTRRVFQPAPALFPVPPGPRRRAPPAPACPRGACWIGGPSATTTNPYDAISERNSEVSAGSSPATLTPTSPGVRWLNCGSTIGSYASQSLIMFHDDRIGPVGGAPR